MSFGCLWGVCDLLTCTEKKTFPYSHTLQCKDVELENVRILGNSLCLRLCLSLRNNNFYFENGFNFTR